MDRENQRVFSHKRRRRFVSALVCLLVLLCLPTAAFAAGETQGEQLYNRFSAEAKAGDAAYFSSLTEAADGLDWTGAAIEFEGNLRYLAVEGHDSGIYIVRNLESELFVVSIPAGNQPAYEGIDDHLGDKLIFNAKLAKGTVDGEEYTFVRFVQAPQQLMIDKVFKTSVAIMFFCVMLGMGMNLTLNEFVMIFKKPKGIIVGVIMQWIIMPLLALGMAYLLGFYHSYPFIYAGMVLICACPGGVTSNLMTYYAKGDLALSVSLTSISTVLSLVFTPIILMLFCSSIPDVKIPADLIAQTIIVLVLIPLVIGMLIRKKWEKFAKKATPYFSALGVFALLMVIGVGLYTNYEKLADTQRYSAKFYIMVVMLSIIGMMVALGGTKLLRLNNTQCRAISMEVGLRNSTLAVTITLLIQDLIGDFYSSMFVTTAIYGITMYITGFLMIWLYKYLLPLGPKKGETPQTKETKQ